VEATAAIDMFVVVSATFQMLYVVIVLRHERRQESTETRAGRIVSMEMTVHATAR
jgi:hypothetical protein